MPTPTDGPSSLRNETIQLRKLTNFSSLTVHTTDHQAQVPGQLREEREYIRAGGQYQNSHGQGLLAGLAAQHPGGVTGHLYTDLKTRFTLAAKGNIAGFIEHYREALRLEHGSHWWLPSFYLPSDIKGGLFRG